LISETIQNDRNRWSKLFESLWFQRLKTKSEQARNIRKVI